MVDSDDNYYLNVYKSFISDSIISNEGSRDDIHRFLLRYIKKLDLYDSDKNLLIRYLNNELEKFYYDDDSLTDDELKFLNDLNDDFLHHISLMK